MRIAVFGTGGVGGYFGGRLAQAGEDVTFIARGEHLRAILDAGLQVFSTKGDFTIQPAKATEHPDAVGPVDLVVVAVKAWQVRDAASAIQPMIGEDTMVLPLQNGIEAYAQLTEKIPARHVISGLCKIVSYIEKPGVIRHAAAEPVMAFGEWDNSPSDRIRSLLQTFRHAGIYTEVPANIQVAIWEKFIFIASISGVGAVTRSPLGTVRSIAETRAILESAMREIFLLGRASSVPLPDHAIDKIMSYVDSLPAHTTASMQRDIMEGRPSELEAQTGAVVRAGRTFGVETPVNLFIYSALLPLELAARKN